MLTLHFRHIVSAAILGLAAPLGASAVELGAVPAQPASGAATSAFDGVVEAVRQTVVAAQVAGAVVQLDVKAGDRVKAGQVLVRLDARAADQAAAASDAQVLSARAALELATQEFNRQQQLYQKNYISKAALERAESEFKSTQAQVSVQLAQSGAARTQSGFYVVRAPFAGVVAEVPVSLGEMAMPGRALLTLYDPAALRVTAAVPQTVASGLGGELLARIEVPGQPGAGQWKTPTRVQVLPTVDPGSHTVEIRAELPAGTTDAVPGTFARLWLPVSGAGATQPAAALMVPQAAIVRRAEMTGLYVLGVNGGPLLRQVRLGRTDGDQVEVLAGLRPGERVVTDPQAAARMRADSR